MTMVAEAQMCPLVSEHSPAFGIGQSSDRFGDDDVTIPSGHSKSQRLERRRYTHFDACTIVVKDRNRSPHRERCSASSGHALARNTDNPAHTEPADQSTRRPSQRPAGRQVPQTQT
ncbi:MAG: hypothetical protein R2733_01645 [Acidimicrobiales bacterium]